MKKEVELDINDIKRIIYDLESMNFWFGLISSRVNRKTHEFLSGNKMIDKIYRRYKIIDSIFMLLLFVLVWGSIFIAVYLDNIYIFFVLEASVVVLLFVYEEFLVDFILYIIIRLTIHSDKLRVNVEM